MIYMDNAATTRMSERAFEAMRPFFMEQYANAAGTYSFANASKEAVEKARKQVAKVIGAKSAETGGKVLVTAVYWISVSKNRSARGG